MSRRLVPLAVLALGLLSGCQVQETSAGTTVYRHSLWLAAGAAAFGVGLAVLGWFMGRTGPKWGYALMAVLPAVLIGVVPMILAERVVVDGEHFEHRHGWSGQHVDSIRYEDLRKLRFLKVHVAPNRTDHVLEYTTRDNRILSLQAGDLLRHAAPEILVRAEAHGVPTVTKTKRMMDMIDMD